MDQFETVLARLHSGDNSARSVGESAYADALASDPGSVVVQLVRVLRAPERSELHAMALVLLRRAVGTHWDKIAAQVRSQLGDELLALLEVSNVFLLSWFFFYHDCRSYHTRRCSPSTNKQTQTNTQNKTKQNKESHKLKIIWH
jgi:hypothetical protein